VLQLSQRDLADVDCCSRVSADYVRHPIYGGLLMAAYGLAVIARSETRLAMAVLLWVVLEKKVSCWHQLAGQLKAVSLCHSALAWHASFGSLLVDEPLFRVQL
jgi:protein-S-isoprenylcysteine O-methyltransferase Ste14